MYRKFGRQKCSVFLIVGGGSKKNKVVNMQLCLECLIANLPCYSMPYNPSLVPREWKSKVSFYSYICSFNIDTVVCGNSETDAIMWNFSELFSWCF